MVLLERKQAVAVQDTERSLNLVIGLYSAWFEKAGANCFSWFQDDASRTVAASGEA